MKNIKSQLLLFFPALIVISVITLSFFISNNFEKILTNSFSKQAGITVEKAAETINPEEFQIVVKEILENKSDAEKILDMEEYKNIYGQLKLFREYSGFKFLYTLIQLPDKTYMFIVDSEDINSDDFSPPGSIEEEDVTAQTVYETQKLYLSDEMDISEEWGVTISSYSPLRDKSGNMIGVIGGDYDAEDIYASIQETKRYIIIIDAVILLISISICFIYARHILKPLPVLVDNVEKISSGDLTSIVTINNKNEIGQLSHSFNLMAENLRTLIGQISNFSAKLTQSTEHSMMTVEQTSHAAGQIASGVANVTQGAASQLSDLQEALRGLEQVTETIYNIESNARETANISKSTADSANEGYKSVDMAIKQMNHIEKVSANSAEAIGKLSQKSKEIGQIVAVISGIAGQTNLLALNAAIEAARAGEEGRGFAVVAEQVRKLAEQSQDATQSITGLINEVQAETENAVNSMTKSTDEVNLGLEVINSVGVKFEEIVGLIRQVTGLIDKISDAIRILAVNSDSTLASVRKIENISQDTAVQMQTMSASVQEQSASLEEVSAINRNLVEMSNQLLSNINKFKI